MRRRSIQILGLIAVGCAMVASLTYILQRHAKQADSFPKFSSFRTLPEGTSILYQALPRNEGMSVERNIQPLGVARYDHSAILMLGIQPTSLAGNGEWFRDMEELAGRGNRVIIGLLPHRNRFIKPDQDQQELALKRWFVALEFFSQTDLRDDEEDDLVAGWPMYFSQSSGWTAIRKENGKTVVVQRAQGKGTLVLMANSYLLSNAAMVDDRQTMFLADLIGPVHQTVFDETHFGIEETGSIAGLARRYRLQGLVLGLVITSLLFIWKNAAGFPPAWVGAQNARPVLGEDSSAAFLNLLRRNIRPEDIVSTCVEAWRKMYSRKAGPDLGTAIDLAGSGRKTPVQTYAQIQQVLSQTGRLRPDGAQPNQS
jgi:hypothetical protein